ncbi:hypothetical protein D3C72_2342120 [compost metagenome]
MDAGRLDDAVDRGSFVAVLEELRAGRIEDAALGLKIHAVVTLAGHAGLFLG